MKNQIVRRSALIVTLVALLSSLALSATGQEMMGKMGKMNRKGTPTVAIIRADWCTVCQKLEPAMAELMEEYKGRLNFVILDVSNEEKTAEAAATARKLGLGKFFEANKKKTSTVAIFGAKNKILFQKHYDTNRETFARAFEDAARKGGRRS